MKEIRCPGNLARITIDQMPEPGSFLTATQLTFRFIFNGEERYRVGRRQLTLLPNQFLVLSPGTQYRYESLSPEKNLSITIVFGNPFQQILVSGLAHYHNEDWSAELRQFSDWVNCVNVYPLKLDAKYNLAHLCAYLEKSEQEQAVLDDYVNHSLISCYLLYRSDLHNSSLRLDLKQEAARADVHRRLYLAREFMQTHYEQKITLKDIADYSCFSVNHLIRTFSQVYLVTPHEYLKRLRLQRARTLLTDTNSSIQEISSIVGFESTSSFIRLFREYFQITPKKFKKAA